jgi:hypothetical protein
VRARAIEQRAKKQHARVLSSRMNKLAAGAVQHAVPLDELLRQVEDAWLHHTAQLVMET